jgi:hypothetical protein
VISQEAQPASGLAATALSPSTARTLLALCFVALAALILPASRAQAAFDHSTIEAEWSIGACKEIIDVDVDEANGWVYVSCPVRDFITFTPAIKRFDLNGNPANFLHQDSYLSDNEIIKAPSNTGFSNALGSPKVAIDNSGGIRQGYIYVSGSESGAGKPKIDVFRPTGEWATSIGQDYSNGETRVDLDVNSNGNLLTVERGSVDPEQGSKVTEYDGSLHPSRRIYHLREGDGVRAEAGGGIFLKTENGSDFNLSKYEADQWSTNLALQPAFVGGDGIFLRIKAQPSPFFPDPFVVGGGSFFGDLEGNFDVDLNRNDVYVNRVNRIDVYSGGTEEEAPHISAPSLGTGPTAGKLNGTQGVAVTLDNRVFASTGENGIVRFGPGNILPDITTPNTEIDNVGHTSAIVEGHIDLAGGADITSCEVEYAPSGIGFGDPGSGTAACAPDPAAGPPGSHFSTDTEVSASLSGLTMGADYKYRFRAGNTHGTNIGIDRPLVPVYVLKVKTLAATEMDQNGATLEGSFEPDADTSYFFEYGTDATYGQSTPVEDEAAAPGTVLVDTPVSDLASGRTFHYRLVASNADGTTYGPDRVFKTASPPDLAGVFASDLTSTTAVLNASIDPVGYDTAYHFEFGPTPGYGHAVPISPAGIGAGSGAVSVQRGIAGLTSGQTYHFRVVATNKWGSSASADTTFDYAPPSCPNAHVRQETRSTYLPDCRAYELVSPPDAGSVIFSPSQWPLDRVLNENDPYGQGDGNTWPVNTGLAVSPARFTFFGGFGAVPGLDPPNTARGTDMYMSTRTATGWTTTLPGLTGSETIEAGRHACSETLDLCSDHKEGAILWPVPKDHAPFMFTASGERLRQVPTNIDQVPGGHNFSGAERWSPDFGHFVFSSTNVAFTPDGQTGGVGSAYDNDVGQGTVDLISRLGSGTDPLTHIPQNGSSTHAIEFPAISADGSHILMETQGGPGGPFRLYLRVNGAVTYDIANGAAAEFVGMTRNGSTVYFTSSSALTPGDEDANVDLYRWSEADDSLTRISQGNGQGNGSSCNISGADPWTSSCDVQPLNPERLHLFSQLGMRSVGGFDDVIADQSGDVYFYSPEILDPERPGIPNLRNLYVYREGTVRLVAVFDRRTQVDRMQISPDGDHAAILTEARLTSYDNRRFRQMYTYDATARQIRCASCNPSGLPPVADVAASQGGPFMADDGRTFFATKDALVDRDANGEKIDVYEYVGGRPQLITTGLGSRDSTGGATGAVFTIGNDIGLESVSADGVDVFFSTFETLTRGDLNGPRVKFYDARTGGGFLQEPELAPCAAADECHGADSSPPPAAVIGTSGNLGATGNVQTPRKKKLQKRKRAKKKKAAQRNKKKKQRKSKARGDRG